jgi:ferrous iron transport protein B
MASTLFYQAATISRHPLSSLMWIATICALFLGVVLIMRTMGGKERAAVLDLPDGARA